ncbi:coiled-coil domain-containing protein 180 [Halichoeres trimaculatus]|uniref:coiled-coil domain-containing protein 180 n=1 Tax=Halichoeres trimaculatus TaxID=147232 RepID=UPI003D9E2E0A
MCESKAVPSGKVYRQLFDAQVQLSRSLLAGRRDVRTECLSAEDSNTHSSTNSSRGQQVDDDDEVDEVCRLPDSVVASRPNSDIIERLRQKKSKNHKEALTELDKELSKIAQMCETQVRTVSIELRSSLQNIDHFLNTLKDRIKNLEHMENVSLQDLSSLWEEVVEAGKRKKTRIMELNHKLAEAEGKRTDQIRAVLKKHCSLLERINFLPSADVHRLIHNEATMLNQSLLANRRSVARLLLTLQEESLQQESLLRLHWEDCLGRWRSCRVKEIVDCYSSDGNQEPVSAHQAVQKMKQTQQELIEKRQDIISNICSLVPPSCSTSLVSDWFNQLTAVNEQIDSFHAHYLDQLRGCYEQMWQNRLTEVESCKEALSSLQLSEEEVNDVVSSDLFPLISQNQSREEERLAAFDRHHESLSQHAASLSRCVFILIRGAALLWETHSRRLKRREEEVQRNLDDLRDSQEQVTQRKKMQLDVLLGALRQKDSEEALKTSLDEAVAVLKKVQQSYRRNVTNQCQLLDRLPSLLLGELLSYSSSLSLFYHLSHTYGLGPKELQKIHPSLSTTTTSDQESSKDADAEEMTEDPPISCELTGGSSNRLSNPAQPFQDWLTEAESSLQDLCDISNDVTFSSSSGTVYKGPAFTCPAPDLPEDQQQETHLILFPVKMLTHNLIRMRTLFLDNLEQHFRDVLTSTVTTLTHRKEVLQSELELHLKQLDCQHIQTHVYQPRLAELQLHTQQVDSHCEEVSDVLTSCRTELQDLQTSISKKNAEFSSIVSNMESKVMKANNSQRLEAVSSTWQDCLDKHIKDTQEHQSTFRHSLQKRLEEVRHKTAQLLSSFRLFSEGGDFNPREVKLFQKKLKEKTKQISAEEKSIYFELEVFESQNLLQVKEVSGSFEETLSVLKYEVKFMERIRKIISFTQVNIKAEAARSNQQQEAINNRLEDLRRMMENTQVCPDQVYSFLSSVFEDFRKRSQYLEFSLDQTLHESLSAHPKSKKQVRAAPPPGLLQPSRKGADLLSDPVVDVIKYLNRFGTIQDDGTEAAEKEERRPTASGQSSAKRLPLKRSTTSVSNLSVVTGSRPDRRLHVFGPKPDPEQTHSLSSAVNSLLWKANDAILQDAEDFYGSKRGSRFLLVPDKLDQWAEGMQQRLLGYQEQARKLLSSSREELVIQLSFLVELLKLLPKVLISSYQRQQEAELRDGVGGVRIKLEETLKASEKEKSENVGQLKASLRDGELQTLIDREELRQQQLHSAICSAHLELQECVRVRGEGFVTSLASLTEKLLHQLDDLLVAEEAQTSQQLPEESSVSAETRDETGQTLGKLSRTFPGIPYLTPPDQPSSVTIATTASIATTRCTSVHVAVIELRDAAVKRFQQQLILDFSRSDDDKQRRLSELEGWSSHWRQQIHRLTNT